MLQGILPSLLAAGVVGFDLRDTDREGTFQWEEDMVGRIKMVLATANRCSVSDVVVNAMMGWPGTVDEAIERANLYLDAGATVVTILRRLPCAEVEADDLRRMIREIKGRVGVLLEIPGFRPFVKAPHLADMGVARIGYGNQWPHYILTRFQEFIEAQWTV